MQVRYLDGPLKGQRDQTEPDMDFIFPDRWVVEGILRTDPANAETDRLLRMTYRLDQEGNARYESGDPDLYYAHCDKCDRYVVGDSASGTGLRFVAHPRSAAFPCYRGDVGVGIEYYWPLPPASPR